MDPRQDLVDYLTRQLVGPAAGDDELLDAPPDRQYLMGTLYPQQAELQRRASGLEALSVHCGAARYDGGNCGARRDLLDIPARRAAAAPAATRGSTGRNVRPAADCAGCPPTRSTAKASCSASTSGV